MSTVRIQLRRDTAANWTSVNPVLSLGEPGFDEDSGVLKMGDGITAWNSLPSLNVGGGTFQGSFTASKFYRAKDLILQDSSVYSRNTAGTSGSTFTADATNWSRLPSVPLVADYADLTVGSVVLAGTLVTQGGFLYTRATDGTISGTFTSANWDPAFAGAALTGVGAPSSLPLGALYFALDGSGFVTGLYLGTSSGAVLVLDATGPILYGTFSTRPAATTLTDGTIYLTTDTGAMYQARSSAWSSNLFPTAGTSYYNGVFGDGSDGSLTFDGTTTVAGLAPSSGVYTMTRDLHATALTNNSGSTIKTAGFRIFCQGAMSNAGTISMDGNNASGATAGATTSGLFVSQPGGNGGTTAGSAGNTGLLGGGASAAGSGASGSGGGTTGVVFALTTTISGRLLKLPNAALSGVLTYGANVPTYLRGGSGAPGGGGDTTNSGGGGGAGGGVLVIFAATLTNTGTLSAKGGNGAAGVAGNSGGGSGGGGGVVAVYTRSAWTQSGTVTAAGGSLGAGVGTGTNGAAGTTGTTLNAVLV